MKRAQSFEQAQIEFDPFSFPPNIDLAIKHQQATYCRKPPEPGQLGDLCPCCGLPIMTEQIPICEDRIEFSFLGQGMPLYYEFVIWVTMLLVLMFLIFGIHAMASNAAANDCLDESSEAYQSIKEDCCKKNEDCENTCPISSDDEDYNKIMELLQIDNCEQICPLQENLCIISNTSVIAFPNKQFQTNQRVAQSILILIFIVIFKVYMQILRKQQKLTSLECDRGLLSPSDYTAMISHLPENQYDEQELRKQVNEFCKLFDPGCEQEIAKVNIAYDISEYIANSRMKVKLQLQINKTNKYKDKHQEFPEKVTEELYNQWLEELRQINIQIDEAEKQIEQKTYRRTTSVAFITFQTNQQLESLLEQTKISLWEYIWIRFRHYLGKSNDRGLFFKNHLLNIQKAPEPNDVFWENCGYNLKYKVSRRIISAFTTIVLLGLSFLIILGIEIAQNRYLDQDKSNYIIIGLLSFFISLIITFINGMMLYFITKLVVLEKQSTRTNYDSSVANKLIYAQFVNTGLIVLATNLLVFNQQLGISDTFQQRFPFERPGGISSDVFFIVAINALVVPLSSYFDIFYVLQLYQQYKAKKSKLMTQIEANRLYQGPQVQMYNLYAHICKSVWITFIFAPLVPISIIFTIFGLIFYFWIQKYLLVHRYCRPPFEGNKLNKEMLDMIELSPILLACGQIWYDYAFSTENSIIYIIDFVALGIGCIELIIPANRLNKVLTNLGHEVHHSEKYNDACLQFNTDYDRSNPITSGQAVHDHIKLLLDKGVKQSAQMEQENVKHALQNYALNGGEMGNMLGAIKLNIKKRTSNKKSSEQKHLCNPPKQLQQTITIELQNQAETQANQINQHQYQPQQQQYQHYPQQNLNQIPYQPGPQYQQYPQSQQHQQPTYTQYQQPQIQGYPNPYPQFQNQPQLYSNNPNPYNPYPQNYTQQPK